MTKTKTNKSAKIREALEANPTAGPTEITKILEAQGVKGVSVQLVSNVRTRVENGGAPKKRGHKPIRRNSSSEISVDILIEAKKFVDFLGSASAATAALEKLAMLRR